MRMAQQIMTEYRRGFKFDIQTGKKVYTAPVELCQHVPEDLCFERASINEIVAAPSLSEAILIGEVRPRTVLCVKALRDDEENAPKRFCHKYDPLTFIQDLAPVEFTSGQVDVLHVWGGTGLGKSKWAVSICENVG